MTQQLGLFNHLTHKANLKHTRYGWLRLTPAYSVHMVESILTTHTFQGHDTVVLDPFCGTGTTALVCAEKGIRADTTDINPFLVWLASTKTQIYQPDDIEAFCQAAEEVMHEVLSQRAIGWAPSIHQIEKWWDAGTLAGLSRLIYAIEEVSTSSTKAIDLLKIAFCRVMISQSNASFGHQSMSFKQHSNASLMQKTTDEMITSWTVAVHDIAQAAQSAIITQPHVLPGDARQLTQILRRDTYDCVITSPPYPNRMSYIRELRPYMYWLHYLQSGREAGELDWQAIGGTWGCATSNVGKWMPAEARAIPYPDFADILERIAQNSPVLSRYVHKYFYDMVEHINELFQVTRSGGQIYYIVGNSKFYDVVLPVEEIYAALFTAAGFENVAIQPVRKRTSKKELYEYLVSAKKG